MDRHLRTAFIYFLCMVNAHSGFSATEPKWNWFSKEPRDLKALYADPRETQVRLGYLHRENQSSFLDMGLGGHMGLFSREIEDRKFSLAIRGLISSRFQFWSGSFDQQSSDFIGGVAASHHQEGLALELFYSHQSSHLGDELFEKGFQRTNVSFESVRFLVSQEFSSRFRLYSGMNVIVRADPSPLSGKITPILGGDWHFSKFVPALFTALDLRFKQENNYSPNLTLVFGYELGNGDKNLEQQRIIFEVYTGHSNQGQFYKDWETYLFLGVGFSI